MNGRDATLNLIATIEEEIEQVERRLKELRQERTRLRKRLYDGRTGELRGDDSLLVLRGDIRHWIVQWIELYDRQHGGKGGQLMLSERSNVSTRLIRSLVNRTGERRFVSLQTADRLLRAAEMGEKVSDLEWFPNGNISTKPQVPEPPPTQYYEE